MKKVNKLSKLIYILPMLWTIVLRCSIGLFPYSGKSKPELYGDFEAQRHWMEITLNVPINEWYFNSSSNDLDYWGLDYPPLTAYHSYFLGLITNKVNSSWTDLFISRGSEHPSLEALMRLYVLSIDILIYLPSISFYYIFALPKLTKKVVDLELILCGLFFPGIILVDYGHFQYNAASLGLYILSSIYLMRDNDIFGSIFFCAALCYKQMELYHSLPIFVLLLSKCLNSSHRLWNFVKIAITVVMTFFLIFLPCIANESGINVLIQIIKRMFPISRGIFEDKVANFWCAISVIFKFKDYQSSTIVIICAICTLLCSLPSCCCLFANPRKKLKYFYASFIVALSFFLFSYQVHEKSILIPSASALLLIPFEPFWANFFLYVATLSMWPLLVKDNLILATGVTSLIFVLFFTKQIIYSSKSEKILFIVFNLLYFTIILASLVIDPPTKYPFLYSLLTSQISCAAFLVQFCYFNWRIFSTNEHI